MLGTGLLPVGLALACGIVRTGLELGPGLLGVAASAPGVAIGTPEAAPGVGGVGVFGDAGEAVVELGMLGDLGKALGVAAGVSGIGVGPPGGLTGVPRNTPGGPGLVPGVAEGALEVGTGLRGVAAGTLRAVGGGPAVVAAPGVAAGVAAGVLGVAAGVGGVVAGVPGVAAGVVGAVAGVPGVAAGVAGMVAGVPGVVAGVVGAVAGVPGVAGTVGRAGGDEPSLVLAGEGKLVGEGDDDVEGLLSPGHLPQVIWQYPCGSPGAALTKSEVLQLPNSFCTNIVSVRLSQTMVPFAADANCCKVPSNLVNQQYIPVSSLAHIHSACDVRAGTLSSKVNATASMSYGGLSVQYTHAQMCCSTLALNSSEHDNSTSHLAAVMHTSNSLVEHSCTGCQEVRHPHRQKCLETQMGSCQILVQDFLRQEFLGGQVSEGCLYLQMLERSHCMAMAKETLDSA